MRAPRSQPPLPAPHTDPWAGRAPPGVFRLRHVNRGREEGGAQSEPHASDHAGLAAAQTLEPGTALGCDCARWAPRPGPRLGPQFPDLVSRHLRGAPGTELVSEDELVRVTALEQGLVP